MIFKNKHRSDFTVLPNALVRGKSQDANKRDDNLTAEGLGVLAYLLSHQEDWQVCGKQMAAHWSISPNKMTKITNLLESEGYLKRVYRKDRSHIWDWIVTDTPHNFGEDRKIKDRIFEDRKNKDRKSSEQRRTKSLKEKLNTKERKKDVSDITGYVYLADAINLCPNRVPVEPWTDWLKGKTTTQKISAKKVKNAHAQFSILRDAGLRNFQQAVLIANSKKWRSIEPHWEAIQSLITAITDQDGVK